MYQAYSYNFSLHSVFVRQITTFFLEMMKLSPEEVNNLPKLTSCMLVLGLRSVLEEFKGISLL